MIAFDQQLQTTTIAIVQGDRPERFGYYFNGIIWMLFLPVPFLLYLMGLYLLFDPFLIVS